MDNRDSVWEQVIRPERGLSVRTENIYSIQEQVIRSYGGYVICLGPGHQFIYGTTT